MKSKVVFFFLFFQCYFMSAQTITINTVEVCAAQEVLLPVTCTSLLNVGALTLYIGFDTTKLSFVSVENIDPQLAGMSTNLMTSPTQLAFAWSNPTPIGFQAGKMFDIKFITNGQSTPVYYNPGCEIADPSGSAIPATYADGSLISGLPVLSMQPKDTTIIEGGQSFFTLLSPNAVSYFWKESQDNGTSWLTLEDGGIYSGTHSPELSIFPVPLSFNNHQYQCVLTRGNCTEQSIPATLFVDALTSAESPSNHRKNIFISPVPFSDHTTVSIDMPEDGRAQIQVSNCLGQFVSEIELPHLEKGHHHIFLNTSDWRPGVYFLRFALILAHETSPQVIKTIKNF